MKKILAFLFALFATPVAAQVIPSGPWGSLNYWGVGGASQVLSPGTPGYCLETQGTGSAPVWSACPGSALSLLPSINTNQFYGNVSGQFAPPVGVDVNTILNTVGYDIVRPPAPESILYKSNVGPTFNWQALPPGPSGALLTSGGPTNPPFWATNPAQGNLAGICTTIGALLYFNTPSLLWQCLAPGTNGQVLQTGGTNGNPSWLTLAPSATTDTTNASNITHGTLSGSLLPAPTVSVLGGVLSAAAPANQFMTGINTSGAPTFAQPSFANLSGVATGAQLPAPGASTLGGVFSASAAANQFQTGINTSGAPTFAQPAFSNLSGTIATSQITALPAAVFANPSASIGLTANNGSATTAMRSDATPALSQSITPTWTGLHLFNGGLVANANANVQASTYGYFDSNPLAQVVLATTGVRTANADANLVLHMAKSVGSGAGAAAFAANILTDSVANSGSAPIWSGALVTTLNSGFTLSGTTVEADMNVNNQNYSNSIATGPWAVNFLASGTHNGSHFFATAAFAATATGDNFPLWNYGIYLGETGFTSFNTASIFDKSNAPTSISISGSHSSYVINAQNTHATAGDLGMALSIGSSGTTDTSTFYMNFQDGTASFQAGSITRADSAGVRKVAYNATSDERLKVDLGRLDDALDRVMKTKVHRYHGHNYSGDEYDVGFFAQELYRQYPWAVTPSYEPDYHAHPWQVDYGRVTPLLTAAIQDQQHEIEDLRRRLAVVERSSIRKGHHGYIQ